MTCFECAKEIAAYPCACGYQPIGGRPAQKPTHRYEPLHDGPMMTKEEFGVNLYEAIKMIGGIVGIDQQRAAAIHKGEGYKVQSLLERRRELQVILAAQLPALTDPEMDQILDRYPWVVKV